METKIKICGLFRPEDIEAVNEAEPDFVGFVFYPKSRRYVSTEKAAELRRNLKQAIKTLGVLICQLNRFVILFGLSNLILFSCTGMRTVSI